MGFGNTARSDGEFSSGWDSREFAEVRLISGTSGIGNGTDIKLGLEFSLKPDWKIYWRSPGDSGSPPIIERSQSVNLELIEMKWPWPERFDEGNNLTTIGYKDHVIFPITAKARDPLKPLDLRFIIEYQVCKTICIPVSTELAISVPPGDQKPTKYASLIGEFEEKVPMAAGESITNIDSIYIPETENTGTLLINVTRHTPFTTPIIFLEGPGAYRFGVETVSLSNSSLKAEFSVPVSNVKGDNLKNFELLITLVDVGSAKELSHTVGAIAQSDPRKNSLTMLSILFTALIGGLVLNLMPCVLPVLSIKILSVLKSAGQSRLKIRLSFLASVGGILFSYLLLALGTILIRNLGNSVGWGLQFQEPLFLVSLVLVLTVFSCNLFGFFEIGAPSYSNNPRGSSNNREKSRWLTQSFFTGALATLMATPCSAPFVGTSISFALSQGATEILLIFAMLGLGMAMPYLLFAANPNLVNRLPRPGKWMIQLRIILGFFLAATAVWLLVILSHQTTIDLAFFIGTIAVLCGISMKLISSIMGNKKLLLYTLTLVVSGCSMASFVVSAPSEDKRRESTSNSQWSSWIELDASKIPDLVTSGKIVFVDITADWCLTCKINKVLVLDSPAIINKLDSPNIVKMRGDWTKRNPDIQNYLFSFNRYGIPFNAVYGIGAPTGIALPELLTKTNISHAVEMARGDENIPGK